jgi:hypothetical protein
MADPLPAGHELVFAAIAKRITHPAVAPAMPTPALAHRPRQRRLLFGLELPARPVRHDEIELAESRFIVERFERVAQLD